MPTAFSINVPSKTANAAAPAATGTTKPQLQGLLQTLPHSVTTFSVSPEPCTLLLQQYDLTGEAHWHHQAAAARPAADIALQRHHVLLLLQLSCAELLSDEYPGAVESMASCS